MVTRLRSDKGSFVRSPKGAFNAASTPPPPGDLEGDVVSVTQPFNAIFQTTPTCQPSAVTLGVGTTTYRIVLKFDLEDITDDYTLGVFTDVTTGNTFAPSAAPYLTSIQCNSGTLGKAAWDVNQTPNFGAFPCQLHWISNLNFRDDLQIIMHTFWVAQPVPVFTPGGRFTWAGP